MIKVKQPQLTTQVAQTHTKMVVIETVDLSTMQTGPKMGSHICGNFHFQGNNHFHSDIDHLPGIPNSIHWIHCRFSYMFCSFTRNGMCSMSISQFSLTQTDIICSLIFKNQRTELTAAVLVDSSTTVPMHVNHVNVNATKITCVCPVRRLCVHVCL